MLLHRAPVSQLLYRACVSQCMLQCALQRVLQCVLQRVLQCVLQCLGCWLGGGAFLCVLGLVLTLLPLLPQPPQRSGGGLERHYSTL